MSLAGGGLAHGAAQRPMFPMFIASACLCGFLCRYDGKSHTVERVAELCRRGLALPVCPETEGGLGVPRSPCEIRGGRVVTKDGRDVTENFTAGAARVLALALERGIGTAILKERSPSCGSSLIYDGTFSGRVIKGRGITAALLRGSGIRVLNETEALPELEGIL